MRETMDRLSGAQNRLRNASMVLLAALAVSVILILLKIRIPGLVLGTAAMVLYFGWVKWQSRKYSGQVTEANILHGLAADLEDPKYLGKKGLTVEELDQAAILPVQVEKGSLLIFQGFEGKLEGSRIRGWETTFRYRRGTGRTDVAFLSGTLLLCSCGNRTADPQDWVAIRRGLVNDHVAQDFLQEKSYTCRKTGNRIFDERFILAGRNQEEIPKTVMKELDILCGDLERIGAVRCQAGETMVFLDHRFYTDHVRVQQPLTEDLILHNPLPERDAIWGFFRFIQQGTEKEQDES